MGAAAAQGGLKGRRIKGLILHIPPAGSRRGHVLTSARFEGCKAGEQHLHPAWQRHCVPCASLSPHTAGPPSVLPAPVPPAKVAAHGPATRLPWGSLAVREGISRL